MRRACPFAVIAAALLMAGHGAFAQSRDQLAPTGRWTANTRGSAPVPPMGWNCGNACYSDIDE